jgi:hypothetical protein
MATQIYMPLRSNAGWFGNSDARKRLERQIKTNLVLYDQLLFQDGRFEITAGDDGQGMQIWFPASSFPGDRKRIEYFPPGGEFGVVAGEKAILRSISETGYSVDFFPIIHEARLEHATFIRWSNDDVLPEFRSAIETRVRDEILTQKFDAVLPENNYIRRHLLEGLYRDALLAHFYKCPFSVDSGVSRVIRLQQEQAIEHWADEIPCTFYQYWVNLELPDLSELGWEEVCEFRESDAGQSFRAMVQRISCRMRKVLPETNDQRDLDHWIGREFNQELLSELSRRVTSTTRTLASLALNVIPFGFIPSALKDLKALDADETSWVSLVKGYAASS